ncbi:GDP-L-galactose phosphorylase 2 [Tetrabaena socialis]|uniref:GDP-D-glucose phosphorylase 1 n=1 Tax=Tetrabaena socialis TaxID=47790 RepID=A0A2J8A321_9CHLO|nr:GDP-L-galactose phosphorylase 2 [Tetrabaena socialis]|eukprot:PNH06914.1 GDP-L-galactose phosphorylase 2 [Tetrabaena socialis]
MAVVGVAWRLCLGGRRAVALEPPSSRAAADGRRYDVSACPTRVVPGAWGFLAQLNEGRATKKRATEFTMDRVVQPFDASKFNFRKAAISEALVAFVPETRAAPGADASSAPRVLPPAAPLAAVAADVAAAGGGPNLVIINVSPIDYGHVLLVPRVLAGLPQALDVGSVLLALQFARELGGAAFRVGYNSLGAFATINHLHFQSYYMPLTMPVERAATEILSGALGRPALPGAAAALPALGKRRRDSADGGAAVPSYGGGEQQANGLSYKSNAVRVSRLLDYPVNAFVVELEAAAAAAGVGGAAAALAAPGGLEAVAAVVGAAAQRMQDANQPFNLLISEGGARVFVFPQRYAERQAAGLVSAELLDTGVNPAAFEIAGHILLKRPEDYEAASEGWAGRLLAEVSLEEDRFLEVADLCFGVRGC